jgi:hypothetical protein
MKKTTLFILAFVFIFSSCQQSSENPVDDVLSDSRSQLLDNVTNNIIIPVHENLQSELENLENKVQDFAISPTSYTFQALRTAWVDAYMSWQSVEMFSMGKAEEIDYIKSMNTYPCNSTQINNNLSSQSYNLDDANYPSWTAQGFPALDYMLYGLDSDSNMIMSYYTGIDGAKYFDYLNNIVSQMISNTNLIIQHWYDNKDDFIGSSGNTQVSSLNVLTNDFIFYYEKGLRANKIGIPCGIWNGFNSYPIGVEAFYRGDLSKALCLESLDACNDFFSFYLDILTELGNSNLSTDILNSLAEAKSAVNNLGNNFRVQLVENKDDMLTAYDKLQTVVPLLKVSMLYALDITVDYQDSDGD